jgi:hypothetical protein
MQVQLKLFGSAMYEYHSQTGRWPTTVDDFAKTSLPAQSRVWRQTANSIVFLWPRELNPDPRQNGSVLFAYWRRGLFNRFGRVWVCWGDLTTKRIKSDRLREETSARKDLP